MARTVWSGTISFGLVAIPVKLFHAVKKKSVSFNQLDERNLARIRYRKVNGETEEEVPEEHIVKGYEVTKGQYLVIDPDELEPFMPVATKTIDLEEFVDLDQIDPVYFDTAYHLAPHENPKPYALLAQAMEKSGKVGIGRYVMRNKQYTAAIRAEEGRLVMSSLAYFDEVVDPSEIEGMAALADVEVSDKEVLMAESLVESLSADFEPWKYHDEYRAQVMTLINMKAEGDEMVAPAAATETPRVIDIMAALEASVAAAKASRDSHPARKAAAAKWGARDSAASGDGESTGATEPGAKRTTKKAAPKKVAAKRPASKKVATRKKPSKKAAAKQSASKKKPTAKKKSASTKQSGAKRQTAAAEKSAAKKSA